MDKSGPMNIERRALAWTAKVPQGFRRVEGKITLRSIWNGVVMYGRPRYCKGKN